MSDVVKQVEKAAVILGEALKETNAGKISIVMRDNDEQPLYGVFAFSERELIKRVKATIEAFDAEDDAP